MVKKALIKQNWFFPRLQNYPRYPYIVHVHVIEYGVEYLVFLASYDQGKYRWNLNSFVYVDTKNFCNM